MKRRLSGAVAVVLIVSTWSAGPAEDRAPPGDSPARALRCYAPRLSALGAAGALDRVVPDSVDVDFPARRERSGPLRPLPDQRRSRGVQRALRGEVAPGRLADDPRAPGQGPAGRFVALRGPSALRGPGAGGWPRSRPHEAFRQIPRGRDDRGGGRCHQLGLGRREERPGPRPRRPRFFDLRARVGVLGCERLTALDDPVRALPPETKHRQAKAIPRRFRGLRLGHTVAYLVCCSPPAQGAGTP